MHKQFYIIGKYIRLNKRTGSKIYAVQMHILRAENDTFEGYNYYRFKLNQPMAIYIYSVVLGTEGKDKLPKIKT